MLIGLAIVFAIVASVATASAAWIVQASVFGRYAAMAILAAVSLSLLIPAFAEFATPRSSTPARGSTREAHVLGLRPGCRCFARHCDLRRWSCIAENEATCRGGPMGPQVARRSGARRSVRDRDGLGSGVVCAGWIYSDIRRRRGADQASLWKCSQWNCLNALPHVKALEAKYRDRGFVVIGVHTPELPHERVESNVREKVKSLGVVYPVVIDNNYSIWNSFENHYWPAAYFIDANGRIRFHHFGEGKYDEQDRVVAKLLAEAGR